MNETALVSECIKYLKLRGHTVWRNNTRSLDVHQQVKGKGGQTPYFKKYRIKFGIAGSPDIIGFHKDNGKFIAVECKVGKNKLSDLQARFKEKAEAANTIYILAYELEDVRKIL